MGHEDILDACTGFEWDDDNTVKNWIKHHVAPSECEEVFLNRPMAVFRDTAHSRGEARYYSLGCTRAQRRLFVVFTIRETRVRVISARDMNQKEMRIYEAL